MENIRKFQFRKWLTPFLTLTLVLVAFLTISTVVYAAEGDVESTTLEDTNANGKIDTVTLVITYANAGNGGIACTQITHATNLATSQGQFTITDAGTSTTVDLETTGIEWVSGAAGSTCTIKLNLDETDTSLSVNTSATAVDVEYNAAGNELRVADAVPTNANVLALLTGATEIDGAAPAYVSSAYIDSGATGTIDRLDITFSENVTLNQWDDDDWAIVAGTVVLTNETAGTASGADIQLALAGASNVTGGSSAPTVAYTAANGTANSVTDGATNNTGDITAQNISDGAAPVILSGTFEDSNNDAQINQVVLTTTADTGLDCTGWVAGNFTASEGGTINLTPAGGDTCGTNTTSTFTITMATGGNADVTGGATDPIVTYTQPGSGLYDGASNDVPTKALLTLDDNAKPILLSVVDSIATGVNTIAFTYSEPITLTGGDGASSTTAGDLTTAGTFVGLGDFGTDGNLKVPTAKNTLAGTGTATITVSLAAEDGGYLLTTDTAAITVPSGTVQGDANTGVVDANSNQVNTAAATPASDPVVGTWDTTPPTISSAVLSDTYYNDVAFVADGTFNTGQDGTADTVVITASETLKTITDAAATRNDWGVTGATNEYGTSITVIDASASSTTFTLNFSGANIYYDAGTLEVLNTQDVAPSFVDRAGNPLASGKTDQTYKACYTGYSCASGTIGNVAVITNSITQPGVANGGSDTTAPSTPTTLSAAVDSSMNVQLTWEDPINTDLASIKVYRMLNDGTESMVAIVNSGTESYLDFGVQEADVAKYAVSAIDLAGNESSKTNYAEITVEAGAEVIAEDVPVEEVPEEEVPGEEEVPADEDLYEEVIITTEDGEEITLTDIGGHWGESAITAMAEEEIVEGDPEGTFRPNEALNRAEAATILYRVLGLGDPATPTEKPFPDVEVSTWYAGYIADLLGLGLVNGNADGTYQPSESINRAEFLKLAMNVYYYVSDEDTKAEIDSLKEGAMTTAYEDLADAWYTPVVTAATELGFVEGRTCDGGKCFNASSEITRAEATTVLYNMFNDYLTAEPAEEEVPAEEETPAEEEVPAEEETPA